MSTPTADTAVDPAAGVDTDIAIVGAGPVGLALAGWLLRESAWRIALIDARDREAASRDARTLALADGSRQLLDTLGAWPPAGVFPIHVIHVSQRGGFGRTLIHREDLDSDALGHVARYGAVVDALDAAVNRLAAGERLRVQRPMRVERLDDEDGAEAATVHFADGGRLRARIVVNAEGGLFQDAAARLGDDAARTRDYGQSALLTTVACTAPLPHWAWERFTEEGPLALLPIAPDRMAVVWVGTPAHGAQRLALDDAAFAAALGTAFGTRLGHFTVLGPRALYPLGLRVARTTVAGRLAAIGNAAQTLHPVAGQGFNLGLRDARQLALALRERLDPAALQAFAASRRADRDLTVALTDTLPRLFAADLPGLSLARGAGLAALDLLPGLRKTFARQWMTGARRMPR